jgi:hypothetical protein
VNPTPVTLDDARAALADLRPALEALIVLRADLAELKADLRAGAGSPLGGVAEAKALEARLYAELERIAATGVQVKGWAPLLLDWPGVRDGVPVLWCWLEGEAELAWYHRLECGFAGRRRVSEPPAAPA